MERIDRDTFRLSTGREVYANHGLVSISRQDDAGHSDPWWEICEGYDGPILGYLANGGDAYGEQEDWTRAECAELADYMIALWHQFKAEVATVVPGSDWIPPPSPGR